MKCPWPVIRLARAIREGATRVEIYADDPIAPVEIAAIAAAQGWSVAPIDGADDGWRIAPNAGILRKPA
jgi:tRNA 2-thiouridine synthesizing protein A